MPDLRDNVFTPQIPATAPVVREPDTQPAAPRGWILIGAPLLGYAVLIAVMLGAIAAGAFVGASHPLPPAWRQTLQGLRSGHGLYDLFMGTTAALYIAVLFVSWLLLPKRGPASLARYFRRVSRPTVFFAVLTGLALAFALVITQAQLIVHHVLVFHQTHDEQAIVPTTLWDIAPALLVVALIGPIVEEVYFRGLLLRWLGSKMHIVFAVLLSALIFAATHAKFVTHAPLEGFILTGELGVLGLATAIWALATRSLWTSFAVHGSYNAAIITLPLLVSFLGAR